MKDDKPLTCLYERFGECSPVKILKEKKGVPTVIEYMGKKYVLHHSDQFKR